MSTVSSEAVDSLASVPRSYFEDESTRPGAPVVSKTGELPKPPPIPVTAGLSDELYEERSLIVLALRLKGYTYREIEEKTGLSKERIRYALRKARAAGQLRDTLDLVDNEAVPQAVENLIEALRTPESANHWRATEKVLDGRGVFRKFNDNKVAGGAGRELPPLQINIIAPGGGPLPTVIVNSEKGSIVGAPQEDTPDA